ncbi:MAG TPA: MBL fold metallo-hydrolase [Methanoregulaceae archaeon]|nr:MBL fold metallo-hydrolase [Methanoregulaceae archaeon]
MEIMPGIHQIDGIIGNSYAINGKKIVLIDTGLPDNSRKIINYIRVTLKRNPNEVSTIILTHYHPDHSGNVYELKNLTGAQVAIHCDDAGFLSGKKDWPMGMKIKTLVPDVLLKDGDKIAGLTCVHCPGHTPGSIALYDPNRKLLFIGDTLRFSDGVIHAPPEEFTTDMDKVKESVGKILLLEFDTMLSGHGEPLMPGARTDVGEFLQNWK